MLNPLKNGILFYSQMTARDVHVLFVTNNQAFDRIKDILGKCKKIA